MMRVGYGYDVHRLVEGRSLILGGVKIAHPKGLLGHSDADVLVHSVIDALLGAAAMGDIGTLFPDTDPRYRGADSMVLLEKTARMVRAQGYDIANIDATVAAEWPRLAPHVASMRQNIADACGLCPDRVSVKATTEEGLGFIGEGRGMAAHAVCCLYAKVLPNSE
jgi:2-C-methyl-D-erythritol 2,4-cyclodiphosphate synthase